MSVFRVSGGRADSAGWFSGSLPPSFQSAAETVASVCGKAERVQYTYAAIPPTWCEGFISFGRNADQQ